MDYYLPAAIGGLHHNCEQANTVQHMHFPIQYLKQKPEVTIIERIQSQHYTIDYFLASMMQKNFKIAQIP